MRSTRPKHGTRAVLGFLAIFIVATLWASASEHANAQVFPVNTKPYGLSYGEWSARHWQWLFSLPANEHPLFDTADCSAGQAGQVWFLGGTFAAIETEPGVIVGEATRECTVPSGTALFLPIVDVECSTIEGNGETAEELRDCAESVADFIDSQSLHLEIDGDPVTNLQGYRVQSPPFTIGPLPDNNVLGAPPGATSLSVSDGVFVMVKPLSVGEHTIHFTGTIDLSPMSGPIFTQDITYTMTVTPRGRLESLRGHLESLGPQAQ
jgi:hypothetical protein